MATELPSKSGLELQIEAEAAELAAVPKLPIQQFMGGPHTRCHICGQLYLMENLKVYETQSTQFGPLERKACPNCHPARGL